RMEGARVREAARRCLERARGRGRRGAVARVREGGVEEKPREHQQRLGVLELGGEIDEGRGMLAEEKAGEMDHQVDAGAAAREERAQVDELAAVLLELVDEEERGEIFVRAPKNGGGIVGQPRPQIGLEVETLTGGGGQREQGGPCAGLETRKRESPELRRLAFVGEQPAGQGART